jgi:acyl dehydratase
VRDIESFTEISGDRNPLHYDEEALRCPSRCVAALSGAHDADGLTRDVARPVGAEVAARMAMSATSPARPTGMSFVSACIGIWNRSRFAGDDRAL